jgi:hypothetical protein
MKETSCIAIREAMLEAEMEELRGIGESDVAMHIQNCADCRARAEFLLQGFEKLNHSLATLRPQVPDTDVIPMRSKSRKLAWLPLPLAAAAVLALLMIPRIDNDDELPRIDAITAMMFRSQPIASPAPGQQAMVIEKNEMTIVWLYGQETP